MLIYWFNGIDILDVFATFDVYFWFDRYSMDPSNKPNRIVCIIISIQKSNVKKTK